MSNAQRMRDIQSQGEANTARFNRRMAAMDDSHDAFRARMASQDRQHEAFVDTVRGQRVLRASLERWQPACRPAGFHGAR